MLYEFLFKSPGVFHNQSAPLMQEKEIAITSYGSSVFLL